MKEPVQVTGNGGATTRASSAVRCGQELSGRRPAAGGSPRMVQPVYRWTSATGKGAAVNEARAETGGPNRTPRSEIGPAVSAHRKKEPVLLLDLSTSMNWGAADEYGPEWPDAGSRRAIVIEALYGLVRVLELQDSEAAAEQASGSDELGGLMTHGFGNKHVEIGDLNSSNLEPGSTRSSGAADVHHARVEGSARGL